MIQRFVEAWDRSREKLAAAWEANPPSRYGDIVRDVVRAIAQDMSDDASGVMSPDPDRVVKIDHGDYQGTLLFVVGARGYQPRDYWYVRVDYGSCSGCDSLEAALNESAPERTKQIATLALHVVQGLKVLP